MGLSPRSKRRAIACEHNDLGATAVEYAVIASLIAAVVVIVVGLLGLQVLDLFTSMLNNWP